VIGGGISGIAAARVLSNSSFEVTVLESRDRIGGRVHTDYSFGCPIDMGASWLASLKLINVNKDILGRFLFASCFTNSAGFMKNSGCMVSVTRIH